MVMVVRASADSPGQQDTSLPLVMQDQGQQRHHQDEDDSTAYHSVGDAGVVAQPVVQRYKVLAWRLCCREAVLFITVVLAVVLPITEETAVHTASIPTVEAR